MALFQNNSDSFPKIKLHKHFVTNKLIKLLVTNELIKLLVTNELIKLLSTILFIYQSTRKNDPPQR